MRIYKSKWFNKWANNQRLTDQALGISILEISSGLVDVDLGGGLFKKRVPIDNQGKRSSLRTIIAYKSAKHAFFIYGFAKNQRENINNKELKLLRLLAKDVLSSKQSDLDLALQEGKLIEVIQHEK